MKLIPGKLYRLRQETHFFPWPERRMTREEYDSYSFDEGLIILFLREESSKNESEEYNFHIEKYNFHIFLIDNKIARCSRFTSKGRLHDFFERVQ